jgi:hypothetical protein
MTVGGKRDLDTQKPLTLHAHATIVIGLTMRRRRIALVTLMGTGLAVVRGRATILRRRLSLVIRHVMGRVRSIAMLPRIVLTMQRHSRARGDHSWVHSWVHVHVVMDRVHVLSHVSLLLVVLVFIPLVNGMHTIVFVSFTLVVLLLFGRQLLR